jgi:hypothetical protein
VTDQPNLPLDGSSQQPAAQSSSPPRPPTNSPLHQTTAPRREPTAHEFAAMSPGQRSDYDRQRSDDMSGFGHAQFRDERGNLIQRDQPSQPGDAPQPGENDAAIQKAIDDSRRASAPATPDGYEPRLPVGFHVPDGVEFNINAKDPMLAEARKIAHSMGLTQDQFSQWVGPACRCGHQSATEIQDRV